MNRFTWTFSMVCTCNNWPSSYAEFRLYNCYLGRSRTTTNSFKLSMNRTFWLSGFWHVTRCEKVCTQKSRSGVLTAHSSAARMQFRCWPMSMPTGSQGIESWPPTCGVLAGAFNNSQGDWQIFAPQGFPGSHAVRPKEFGAVEIGCQRYVGPTCQQHQFHL